MPIIPPGGNPPYDAAETVLNFARVIANDCGLSLAGNLLSDNQPYVFPMLNLAWRKLQDRLGNNAIESFPEEIIIPGVPAQGPPALTDPTVFCYINYDSYFDGNSAIEGTQLPQDLQIPLRVWERATGNNGSWIPMSPSIDGLVSKPKSSLLREWEWLDDQLNFIGASQALDLRVRYRKFIPDLLSDSTEVVPLLRCAVALAYLVVEIFAAGRGSTILPVFHTEKEDAIKQLINSTTRKQQRTNFRRQPYSRRARGW